MEKPLDRERRELLDRMEAIIRRMPPVTREIFLAHRLDDMPYEAIARRTGLSVRDVERHIASALVLLDRGLHQEPRPWWKFW